MASDSEMLEEPVSNSTGETGESFEIDTQITENVLEPVLESNPVSLGSPAGPELDSLDVQIPSEEPLEDLPAKEISEPEVSPSLDETKQESLFELQSLESPLLKSEGGAELNESVSSEPPVEESQAEAKLPEESEPSEVVQAPEDALDDNKIPEETSIEPSIPEVPSESKAEEEESQLKSGSETPVVTAEPTEDVVMAEETETKEPEVVDTNLVESEQASNETEDIKMTESAVPESLVKIEPEVKLTAPLIVKTPEPPAVIQTHTIVIPSYSTWFKFDKINSIEKKSLPEFFNNRNINKTPEIYVNYRNFMINTYRLNPNEYLTVTVCRRNLVGDAATILRVHRFLNKWGLINYQVDPVSKPIINEPPSTGNYQVDLDTPKGLFPFESYKPPIQLPDLTRVKQLLGDTSGVEGHVSKKPKIYKNDIDSGWTQEEVAKLLEGINRFQNDWNSISDFVGNHTPEECIIRFLQLPIEDKFIDENPEIMGPLKYLPHLPFSKTDNPVMSTLAFLASLVDHKVAALASTRAIKVMDENLLKKLNADKTPLDESSETNGLTDIKDAAATSFGILGAKSHVFASYQEREMQAIMTSILNQEVQKIDLKLKKLNQVEKEFELNKKIMLKQQQEIFLDRLALNKQTTQIQTKFQNILELLTEGDGKDDVEKAKELVQDLKKAALRTPRASLNILNLNNKSSDKDPGANDIVVDLKDEDLEEQNEDLKVKPVSFETPQMYRYWSG